MKNNTPQPLPVDLVKVHETTLIKATNYKAVTPEDYAHGGVLLKMLTEAEKNGEERKGTVLKPLLEAVKKMRSLFSPFEDSVKACKDHIKGEMRKYQVQQDIIAAKERERILNDARIKKQDTLDSKIAAIVAPPSANTRSVVVLKVTDMGKIPAQFFNLDETRLKQWLKEGNTCEGAKLVKDKIIVS